MTSADERTGREHSPRAESDKPPQVKFLPPGDAAYIREQSSVVPSSNGRSIPLAPEARNKENRDADPSGLGLTREVLRSNGMMLRLICIVVVTTLPLAVIMSGVAAPLALLLLLLGYKASIAAGIAAAGSSIVAATVGIFRRGRPHRRSGLPGPLAWKVRDSGGGPRTGTPIRLLRRLVVEGLIVREMARCSEFAQVDDLGHFNHQRRSPAVGRVFQIDIRTDGRIAGAPERLRFSPGPAPLRGLAVLVVFDPHSAEPITGHTFKGDVASGPGRIHQVVLRGAFDLLQDNHVRGR